MSRALWLVDLLADEFRGSKGFQVDYMPGWETRGKSTFAPRGVMNHHTGGGSYQALLTYMTYTSSIAPLCNIATSRPSNGIVRITVVASGKANHAGKGYLPWTGTNMGNTYTIGFENQNDGRQTWPDQQNEAIARANVVCLKKIGQGVDRLADHKTYAPSRKVDRVHINLDHWKNYVAGYMNPEPPANNRRYEMIAFGLRGTPDYDTAACLVNLANKGVATASVDEAKAAVERGEKVVAIGGPAIRALGFNSTKGKVTVSGNKVSVHGNNGLHTAELAARYLQQ